MMKAAVYQMVQRVDQESQAGKRIRKPIANTLMMKVVVNQMDPGVENQGSIRLVM